MRLNQQGSTQLILCLFLLMSLSGITIVVIKKIQFIKINRVRYSTLVCMRKSQYYHSRFIYNVMSLNRYIQLAYFATYSPIPHVSSAAKVTLNGLKLKQQYELLKFYKEIYKLKRCSNYTKMNHVTQSIFQLKRKLFFKRRYDHVTLITQSKSLTITYFTNEKTLLKLMPILFKSKLKVDNPFDTTVKISTVGYEI